MQVSVRQALNETIQRHTRFIKPPFVAFKNSHYCEGYKTYSEYNYLQAGFSPCLKSMHFEIALRLTEKYFYRYNVIDFGCSDGPFLPSLSRYFNHVVGIDKEPEFIEIASELCSVSNIKNVELISTHLKDLDGIRNILSLRRYHLIFLLETLEHVGQSDNLYESKIAFIKQLFTFIDRGGLIIISVPKMVGISFLIQRIGLACLRLQRESLSFRNLILSSFFNKTDDLEKYWNAGHLGFNHLKLERLLKREFLILVKKDIFFQMVYVIARRRSP